MLMGDRKKQMLVTVSEWGSMVLRSKLVYLLLFRERRNEVPQLLV